MNASYKNIHDRKIAGAAEPIILIDYEGDKRPITLWPEQLGDKDSLELDAWVRAYYLYVQRSNIPEDLSEEVKVRAERVAQMTAAQLNWYSGEGIPIMASIEGMTQILYMSIRRRTPDISPDKLRTLLMDDRNLDQVNDVFEKLNLIPVGLKNPTKRGKNNNQPMNRKERRAKKSVTRKTKK